MLSGQMKASLFSLGVMAMLSPAALADPLAAKTMVVYVSNSPDSVAVKDYYTAARSITNTCAITLPDISVTTFAQADYVTYIRNPIRTCLNGVSGGAGNILYIVLAYVRPYIVQGPSYHYAIDSYLADIWDQFTTQNPYPIPGATHRYYAANQSQGNFYLPFQSLEAYRSTPRSSLIYSVWRLDGATKAIATGLVDKATSAMNSLTGAACIDRGFIYGASTAVPDAIYGQGEWDLRRAGEFLAQAGFAVTDDQELTEVGTSPAPAKCPADGSPLGFFAGWYSYNNYNGPNVFNFAPGAIGIHMDSAAALDPRSGPNWVANALQNGITVTAGAMTEPYLEGIPRPGGIVRNLLAGANVGDAFLRNTRWIKWTILNIGDPLYRPFPAAGLSPFNALPSQASLFLPVREVVGGASTTGTVNLDTQAPSGGLLVSLSSTIPSAANTPPSVLVPANAKSANFPITTSMVTETALPFITASFGATTVQNTLSVNPLLSSLGLSSSTASGGNSITGGVFLNTSAPAGGAVIQLVSLNPSLASVPPSVTVPAGISRVEFPIATSAVTSNQTVKIQATYAGRLVEVTITLVPAISSVAFDHTTVNSGGFVVFSVFLTTPAPIGGAVVTLSNSNPAAAPLSSNQITVPAGQQYGNIGITVGTGPATATITASYGGDSKSATVTVN